jgi:signal transduction histidine kinase
VAAVALVNAASVWEIVTALRDVRDESRRTVELETLARARGVESALASTRADLAFLAGASLRDEVGRAEVGASLLLFLRGHEHVSALRVHDAATVIESGRPRGVPAYWVRAPDAGAERCPILGEVAVAVNGAPRRVEACVDGRTLLARVRGAGDAVLACEIRDAAGSLLASDAGAEPSGAAAVAGLDVADWRAPAPWRLLCARLPSPVAAAFEPLVERQRTIVTLNLLVMGLAALLGGLALQQARRRLRSEDRAREEVRVRELERQLFHAERLSTVGRLAAGLAHEINNPLEGMSNYLHLAREALTRSDVGTADRRLAEVRHGLDRVAAIARRVLDHAGRGPLPDRDVDLGEVMARAVELVRVRPEFASIRFAVDLAGGPAIVRGSPVTLGQVFLNLALNACEAQSGSGEVSVGCRREADQVVADVADRGPGVPFADRDRIFEPFESSKRSLGLGLSICRSIVAEHGGAIEVTDRPGGGAVFRVRLPAAEGGDRGDD